MIFTREEWNFINSFAPWLSAIGTIIAVITSLYLALRDNKVRLRIYAYHSILLIPGEPNKAEYFSINVVNIGRRVATISSIGWRIGIEWKFFKKILSHKILETKYYFQQEEFNCYSSTIPFRINDGEEAKYLFPYEKWKTNMFKILNERKFNNILRLQIMTTEGTTFTTKIHKKSYKRLLKETKEMESN